MLKVFSWLGVRSTLLISCTCALLASASLVQASLSAQESNQRWILQLGYFSDLENALGLKQTLAEAGFEAQVLSTGPADELHYRLVSTVVSDSSTIKALNDEITQKTGNRGYIIQDFYESTSGVEPFSPPANLYLLAQAGPATNTSNPLSGTNSYDPMLNRTPQEEIESSPGFTTAKMQIIPTLGLSIGYDDNVTLAPDHEISSSFYIISPALRVEIPTDHSVVSIIAAAEYTRYQDSPIDNNLYWYLRGEWTWDISTREDINLFTQYSEGADRRGRGRRQGYVGLVPADPDEWELWEIGGRWDYGAIGSRGRLTLLGGASDLSYTNNRGDGDRLGTRALDRDWWYYGGTFYFRIAPKSSLLLDYRHTDIDYKVSDEYNSEEDYWMAGITWDATARTSGTLKYGRMTKDFDDPERPDYKGPTWVGTISWRPRTYSVFTLTGSRTTEEPEGHGNYVLRQDITLSWVHDWATRFGTTVDIGYGEDEFRPDDRTDDLFYWGIGGRYTFNQHFRFGASVTSYNRDSIIPQYDYDNRVYMLSLEATY